MVTRFPRLAADVSRTLCAPPPKPWSERAKEGWGMGRNAPQTPHLDVRQPTRTRAGPSLLGEPAGHGPPTWCPARRPRTSRKGVNHEPPRYWYLALRSTANRNLN